MFAHDKHCILVDESFVDVNANSLQLRYARRMHDKDKQGFGAVAGKEGGGSRGRAKKRLELAVSVSWDTCAASATGKKLGKTTNSNPSLPLPCPCSPQETNNVC